MGLDGWPHPPFVKDPLNKLDAPFLAFFARSWAFDLRFKGWANPPFFVRSQHYWRNSDSIEILSSLFQVLLKSDK